ncbi:MAG TPA: alpha/beta hydrolase [Burkholderiales bacterium]
MEIEVRGNTEYAYTGGKAFDPRLPAVVFIHGAGGDHSVWLLQSRYLAHHGYGVLAVDLPGHGRSRSAPLERIEDMADWIVALLDAAGVGTAALVGHSMGSLVALDCAGRYETRVSRLALLGTAFPMRVTSQLLEAARTDEPTAHRMINVWSNAAWAHYPNNPGPGTWVLGANVRLMERQRPGVLYADLAACNNYAAGLERARETRAPALLVLGARDLMTPPRAAQELAQSLSGARVVTLAGCGHNMMAEQPDEVLDALLAFLREG